MNSSDLKNILILIGLTFLFSLAFLLTTNEYILAAVILALMVSIFAAKYHKGEITLFIVGLLTGILLELGGDAIYKLQYWAEGSFFGIPLWLPLFWGYAFILINRIGRIVVKQ